MPLRWQLSDRCCPINHAATLKADNLLNSRRLGEIGGSNAGGANQTIRREVHGFAAGAGAADVRGSNKVAANAPYQHQQQGYRTHGGGENQPPLPTHQPHLPMHQPPAMSAPIPLPTEYTHRIGHYGGGGGGGGGGVGRQTHYAAAGPRSSVSSGARHTENVRHTEWLRTFKASLVSDKLLRP
jgi:hypothetical protein